MAQRETSTQLKANVLRFVRNQSVDGRIRAMVLDLVNQSLRTQSIHLSNQEKDALTHDILKEILLEMLKEYQDISNQN
jgi:hypothetical protein